MALMHSLMFAIVTMVELTGVSYSDTNKWMEAGLGFEITAVHLDTAGMWVQWKTDQEPPYFIGVYDPRTLGLDRSYPMSYKITHKTNALIPCREYLKADVYVQVGTVEGMLGKNAQVTAVDKHWKIDPQADSTTGGDEYWSYPPPYAADFEKVGKEFDFVLAADYTWVRFIPGNLEGYEFRVCPAQPYTCYWVTNTTYTMYLQTESWVEDTSSGGTNGLRFVEEAVSSNHPFLYPSNSGVSPWTWQAPIQTSATTIYRSRYRYVFKDPKQTLKAEARVLAPTEYKIPWVRVPQGSDSKEGSGYRIVAFEDHGFNHIKRAYSARPYRSDEYRIRKPAKAISVWDGKRIRFDWLGRPYFSDNTNAVPGRLYMNGVPW